jgi:hypothetical protein
MGAIAVPVRAALVPVAKETWLHERFDKADLRAVIKAVSAAKRTGALTLHFLHGGLSSVEWRQKENHRPLTADGENPLTEQHSRP